MNYLQLVWMVCLCYMVFEESVHELPSTCMDGISIWNSLLDKQEPENHKHIFQQLLFQKLYIN